MFYPSIKEISDKIRKHRRILNYRYANMNFTIDIDDDFSIFIDTRDEKEDEGKVRKIKKTFGCDDVLFNDELDESHPPFYSLSWKMK